MKKPKKILPVQKHSRHDSILNDYQKTKQTHLEKLATKMLNNDEKFSKLKEKKINNNILDLF